MGGVAHKESEKRVNTFGCDLGLSRCIFRGSV